MRRKKWIAGKRWFFGGGERVVVRKLVPAFAGPTVGVCEIFKERRLCHCFTCPFLEGLIVYYCSEVLGI